MRRRSILFIRRDNIGDLVCTTPAIRAVRLKYPEARIAVFVNSYNAGVVANNPDIDEVYVYEKEKHALSKGRLRVFMENLGVIRRIRKERFDVAVGCGAYSPTLARYTFLTGARIRIGYSRNGSGFFYNKVLIEPADQTHEVIKTFNLVRPLGITGDPGAMVMAPDTSELKRFLAFKASMVKSGKRPLLAVCISARIVNNRWPLEKFIGLIEEVIKRGVFDPLLLWAPGTEESLTFPGDDGKAGLIRKRFGDRILAYPTDGLGSLVAAISSSDMVLSLDTGSLHISAALKRPTIALMTKGKAVAWYPWKTESVVLTADIEVGEIEVEDVLGAIDRLKGC